MAGPKGFAWWDTHDQTWRRARILFLLASAVVAVYVACLLLVLGASLRAAEVGSWDDLGDASAAAVVAGVIAVFAGSALVLLVVGWRGFPRFTSKLARARRPTRSEAELVHSAVASFVPAYGIAPPTIRVIDDPAPNALAFGRPAAGFVCVTSGALRLRGDEVVALCQFHVTALASRAFAYATAAADLVLLGEWCTRVLWASCAFVMVSTLFGVPAEIALAYVVGVVATVIVTRPLLFVADRGVTTLLDDVAQLVDLETVRHTAEPAPLARLLLDLLDDDRRVQGRWEIAHLWFERDTVDIGGRGALPRLFTRSRATRQGLLERAAAMAGQSIGDTELQARLDRARSEPRKIAGGRADAELG